MPIIESPSNVAQLLQGDILQGVRLFATSSTWEADGGDPARSPHDLSLVLSRPCVAKHKRNVVVAAVAEYHESIPKDIQSFEKVQGFLSDMRDGFRTPDVFYLGQVPGRNGRFGARLDAIYTVEVPASQPQLEVFLKERRVGTLNGDFVRDLHLRVFRAFASLGFNDEEWLSDEDLNWLVGIGEAELLKAEGVLSEAEAAKLGRVAEGKRYEQGTIDKLKAKVDLLKQKLEPYRQEKSRRR